MLKTYIRLKLYQCNSYLAKRFFFRLRKRDGHRTGFGRIENLFKPHSSERNKILPDKKKEKLIKKKSTFYFMKYPFKSRMNAAENAGFFQADTRTGAVFLTPEKGTISIRSLRFLLQGRHKDIRQQWEIHLKWLRY